MRRELVWAVVVMVCSLVLVVEGVRLRSSNQPPVQARGDLMTCIVERAQRGKPAVEEMVLNLMSHSPGMILNRHICFSAGAPRRRREGDMILVDAGQNRSTEWGVTLETSVEKESGSTVITALNNKVIDVTVSLLVRGANVFTEPGTPLNKTVRSGDVVTMVKVRPSNPFDEMFMVWKWDVEPLVFRAPRSTTRISSNLVHLVIRSFQNETVFEVLNDRPTGEDPVHFNLNILPEGRGQNLRTVSGGFNVFKIVEPGAKLELTRVSPIDQSKPWGFTFVHRWQTGSSPRALFGAQNFS